MSRALLTTMLIAAGLAAAPRADACFNTTQAEVDGQVKKVKSAEAALDAEDQVGARRILGDTIKFLVEARMLTKDGVLAQGKGELKAPDPGLLRRAYRIDALAQSRMTKGNASAREAAVKTMEKEVLTDANDPAEVADYAEALSRVPARAAQAVMLLRALAGKDLIGSGHAYAALARLEKAAGNGEAAKDAQDRCRARAVKKAICEV